MIDSRAANSGAEKLIAIAPASGISQNAITVKVCEIDCDRPRARWSRGRRVANTASAGERQYDGGADDSETKERKNITSPTG